MNKLDIIESFGEKRILLIGDTILDVYSYGKEVCKSSDSQAMEVEEEKVSVSFGGASGVANNILELGGQVVFFSVIGNDVAAKHYDSLVRPKLNKNFIVDKQRPTIVKKRFWVNGQKVFQINRVDNQDVLPELEQQLIIRMQPFLSEIDLILVLDARHGLLTKNLITQLISLAQKHNKPLYVDSQISHRKSNHRLYKGADCVFLNNKEVQIVWPGFNFEDPENSLKKIKEKLGFKNIVVKLGGQGAIALFNDKYIKGSSCKATAVDPCGAGDAFLASFSLGNREKPEESLTVANAWAALSTTIYGTMPPKKQDLINLFQ